VNTQRRCPAPKWYQELLLEYPLGGLELIAKNPIPNHPEGDQEVDCQIHTKKYLRTLAVYDYLFCDYGSPFDEFRAQWFPFGESPSAGEPKRWLIPVDEKAKPIVYGFNDGLGFETSGKRLLLDWFDARDVFAHGLD
jgi:hypothetical protein